MPLPHLFVKEFLNVPVGGEASGEIFVIDQAEDMQTVRFEVQNIGDDALASAVFEGGFDGVEWYPIDATAITAAFGALGSGEAATHLVKDITFPRLRFTLGVGEGDETIVNVRLLHQVQDVI